MTFPQEFLWGAATASYQIEGAAFEDGKGKSVWDVFAHTPGKVWSGHNGDAACDHYHRLHDDVNLMQQIGLQAYRFSLSWPRVLPDGTDRVNAAGLDFYDRLVDALLAANITPFITLFHWDMPYALYRRGGWLNRDIAGWFGEYAARVTERLGDRAKHWITLNEPEVFVNMGHGSGEHAPGDRRTPADMVRIVHHTLLAHAEAVAAIRANVSESVVGIAHAVAPRIPVDDSEEAIHAAAQHMFEGRIAPDNFWPNTLWADPIQKGDYPSAAYAAYGEAMQHIQPKDLDRIHQAIDFAGLNIYFGILDGLEPLQLRPGADTQVTRFDWPIMPEALYWGPRFFHERYGLPIYITENGLSSMDWVTLDGTVPDYMRIDFTRRYLRQYRRAAADGVNVRGYFHWSLMDNFEWAEGYKQRFGLIYVDFDTKQRTLKESAKWYRTVIESNGANL